ncbi:hypothetical protein L227DRAFT_571705 [Lentinus tigrinus ALCF2SS1-6]|uniref:Uncharacterized protein n=1 Tax=Lentinus tigrinus ALCF2SS1-6 TaxID=1328759 RepID=A0A5C2SLU5_9APHY|nr:hypothetical protein L227DRAFT_571705 [Lentinus tigrinus ALCF2SS1-6]
MYNEERLNCYYWCEVIPEILQPLGHIDSNSYRTRSTSESSSYRIVVPVSLCGTGASGIIVAIGEYKSSGWGFAFSYLTYCPVSAFQ